MVYPRKTSTRKHSWSKVYQKRNAYTPLLCPLSQGASLGTNNSRLWRAVFHQKLILEVSWDVILEVSLLLFNNHILLKTSEDFFPSFKTSCFLSYLMRQTIIFPLKISPLKKTLKEKFIFCAVFPKDVCCVSFLTCFTQIFWHDNLEVLPCQL